jgi:hypothetical protein
MRIRTTTGALAAVVAFALAGCSSGSSDSKAVDEPGVSATTAAGVAAKLAPKVDAASVTKQVTAAIPSVKTTVVYTDATDPNGKLGRPHQYVSKTAFADSRISKAKAKEDANGRSDAISYGGTTEVFATEADAKAWVDYVDRIGQAVGGLVTPDYLLRHGRVVLRVSHLLTTAQVAEYKAVLAKLG